jgi:hypothetical protein
MTSVETLPFEIVTNYKVLLKTIIAMNFSYLFKYIVIGDQSKLLVTRVSESLQLSRNLFTPLFEVTVIQLSEYNLPRRL